MPDDDQPTDEAPNAAKPRGPASAPADLELPSEPLPPTEPGALAKPGPVPEHILNAAAAMAAGGARAAEISTATGVPVRTVDSWLTEGKNEKFQEIYEHSRGQILRTAAHHQIKLHRLMDFSYDAIERAVNNVTDLRLAAEQAWKVMDRCMGPPDKPTLDVNVGFQNVQVNNQVNKVFGKMTEKFANLLETVSEQDPDQYIRNETPGYQGPKDDIVVDVSAGPIDLTGITDPDAPTDP
jgi:hypothetical protein